MTDTATLSTKFQISIPKGVRETCHWEAGQKFAFIPKGAGVMLVPIPEPDELFGIAEGASPEFHRDRDDRT
jgi:AbrB family looped-hinge helix DNA binding protein